jgi:hypothetical protein
MHINESAKQCAPVPQSAEGYSVYQNGIGQRHFRLLESATPHTQRFGLLGWFFQSVAHKTERIPLDAGKDSRNPGKVDRLETE